MVARTKNLMRVLRVEDDHDVGSLFAQVLTGNSHEARLVSRPQQALEVAKELQPEVVFLDLCLNAEIDGYALASRLRSEAGLHTAEIIAVSSSSPNEQRQKASGIDRHIMKPVKAHTLLDLLRKHPK